MYKHLRLSWNVSQKRGKGVLLAREWTWVTAGERKLTDGGHLNLFCFCTRKAQDPQPLSSYSVSFSVPLLKHSVKDWPRHTEGVLRMLVLSTFPIIIMFNYAATIGPYKDQDCFGSCVLLWLNILFQFAWSLTLLSSFNQLTHELYLVCMVSTKLM
jgi:hypothetical protein